MTQSTRLESYLQDVSHALGRKVSGIERAPYEVLNALHEHRQMQSFARRPGWWPGDGGCTLTAEARTRESGAAGLWVKEYVSSGYGHVDQVFNFRKPTVFPGLSSAQPSLSGFCSSASAYINYSNPVFSTHQL